MSEFIHHDFFGIEIPVGEPVLVTSNHGLREVTIEYFTEKSCVQVRRFKTVRDKKIYHKPDCIIVMTGEQKERYKQRKFWTRLGK